MAGFPHRGPYALSHPRGCSPANERDSAHVGANVGRQKVLTVQRQTQRSVPFFDYKKVFSEKEERYLQIVRDVMRRGAFILQQDLAEFEAKLARYVGVAHAVGVGSATDALVFTLRSLDIGAGDEVIFPSHTMVATPAAVVFTGGTPVPVECGSDHLIDPEAVRAAITNRTRVVMPVHLNGRTASMHVLEEVAEASDLLIVEDAAQALGARYGDRRAGSFGRAAAFSFYPAKSLGCLGDGGAVVTNDDLVADRVRQYRDHGRGPDGEVMTWGLNSRLDNLQAAILNEQLGDYDAAVTKRRRLARVYAECLGDLAEVSLPPGPDEQSPHFDIFQNYEVEAESRDALRDFLNTQGIGTLIQWGGRAVHQIKALGFQASLPVTERLFTRCLLLPMNTTLSEVDVEYVCRSVRAFYRGPAQRSRRSGSGTGEDGHIRE